MTPIALRAGCLLCFLATIPLVWWDHWYFRFAPLLFLIFLIVIDLLVSRLHHIFCANYFRSQGRILKWFGQLPGKFVNKAPSPYPWWVYYKYYDAIELIGNEEFDVSFHIYGPFLALVRPTILCQAVGDATSDETEFARWNDAVVVFSETSVSCTRHDGRSESMKWNDLRRVVVVNRTDNPTIVTTYWVLFGKWDSCTIPWGAIGETELIERLQSLPGFPGDLVALAASLKPYDYRQCWKRR